MATSRLRELASQIAKLTSEEQRQLVRIVPQLLKLDEEFILSRQKKAHKDLAEGKAINGYEAISKTKAKREKIS